ncbi:uncharacterized protein LOC135161206 [Diachasmimorpha longicaudata]|uniref:uncharacterized protein LOC135161206 n=1 Tax=Diachasmimorpha longicaudata TaxID=58733 RepID=UPI0030B8D498
MNTKSNFRIPISDDWNIIKSPVFGKKVILSLPQRILSVDLSSYSELFKGNFGSPISKKLSLKITLKSLKIAQNVNTCKSLRKVSCRRRSCSGSCVVTTTPNFHLFIDLPQGSPQSSIGAIPKSIQREFDYRGNNCLH